MIVWYFRLEVFFLSLWDVCGLFRVACEDGGDLCGDRL